MNCYPLFSYLFFIALYINLFVFMFQPKLENIIMVFLFVTTFIGGYNLFMDLKKREIYFEFGPIINIFEDGSGLDIFKILLFSPFTTAFLFVLFIIAFIGYFTGQSASGGIPYIVTLGILLFITNMVQLGINLENIKLAYMLILPMLMILLSLLFILIGIYNINANATTGKDPMPYSQLDPNGIYYKIMMILEISILILFLTYFVLFYGKQGSDKNMQFQLYTIMALLYGMSGGMVYLASNVLKRKFLGNNF